MNKFKTLKQFDLKKSLNNTSSDSWNKIQINATWGDLANAFRKNSNLIFAGNKLKNQEVYRDFSQFINPETAIVIT